MRILSFVFLATLFSVFGVSLFETSANAQTNVPYSFTTNFSLGSSGPQVLELQKILNRDNVTQIASTGPGSPGQETIYFGSLTKAAVIRFQEKYASETLAPAGIVQGSGYVGLYTRKKLNTLSTFAQQMKIRGSILTPPIATSTLPTAIPPVDYVVKESEKIDIYAGDKMLESVRSRILAAINTAITSQSSTAITMPTLNPTDVPSVVIGALSPQSGIPGTSVAITGSGILSNSVIYFGNDYIVRSIEHGLSGTFSFVVPSIPPGRYDLAIKTGGNISNTFAFVVIDPKNSVTVHIQDISPATITYGGTLTITGSGFSPQNNTVVTTYQTFNNLSSADGKTLIVPFSPSILQEAARIGTGTKKVPTALYIVNDYGFSDSKKSFTMTL